MFAMVQGKVREQSHGFTTICPDGPVIQIDLRRTEKVQGKTRGHATPFPYKSANRAIISPKGAEKLNSRVSQRFSKRWANAASIECGHVQINSKKENLMNTTNSVHPKKVVSQTPRNRLFNNS